MTIALRRVHAVYGLLPTTRPKTEVVRYAVARRWFIEREGERRRTVTVAEAARAAAEGVRRDWGLYWPKPESDVSWGLPGGALFDDLVKEACPLLGPEPETKRVDADLFMRCPCCGCWMEVDERQVSGGGCIVHEYPGCGFHGYVAGRYRGYVHAWGDPNWRG